MALPENDRSGKGINPCYNCPTIATECHVQPLFYTTSPYNKQDQTAHEDPEKNNHKNWKNRLIYGLPKKIANT